MPRLRTTTCAALVSMTCAFRAASVPRRVHSRRRLATSALERLAGAERPAHLSLLIELLSSVRGASSPAAAVPHAAALHPLMVPLATDGATVYGLLSRAPNLAAGELPVVSCAVPASAAAPAGGLVLVATSAAQLAARLAAEADVAGDAALLPADLPGDVYAPGAVAELNLGLDKWLALRKGPMPDVYERLCLGHLERGDEQSALITCDRMASAFAGWGATLRFHSDVMAGLDDRADEARDLARGALATPLWSIAEAAEDLAPVVERATKTAALAASAEAALPPLERVAALRLMMREAQASPALPAHPDGLAPEIVEELVEALDAPLVQGSSWADGRQGIAAKFEQAGDLATAELVRAGAV